MQKDEIRERLVELLSRYFDIGDSYAYNLTRDKNAFNVGTMSLEDFEEFDEDAVDDIAGFLLANGVTIQQWIPVSERLPQDGAEVLVCDAKCGCVFLGAYCEKDKVLAERWLVDNDTWGIDEFTHWAYLPPLPEPPKEVE